MPCGVKMRTLKWELLAGTYLYWEVAPDLKTVVTLVMPNGEEARMEYEEYADALASVCRQFLKADEFTKKGVH
jgi:hypothetical protein